MDSGGVGSKELAGCLGLVHLRHQVRRLSPSAFLGCLRHARVHNRNNKIAFRVSFSSLWPPSPQAPKLPPGLQVLLVKAKPSLPYRACLTTLPTS